MEQLLSDPEYLLHQIDFIGRRALFVRMDEQARRAAAFLDERVLPGISDGAWLPLPMLIDAEVAAHVPAGYVFHIGHCGSTLLSRLIEQWPDVLCLREPWALRALAEARPGLGSPTARIAAGDWQRLLSACGRLLSRPLRPGQRVFIKATSTCNGLADALLDLDPAVPALILHMPLASYLAAILKSDTLRREASVYAAERLEHLLRIAPDIELQLHELDAAQMAALGWVVEQARLAQLFQRHDANSRLLALDFETYLAQPDTALADVARHFGLADDADAVRRALASPAASRYSKDETVAYRPEDRQHDIMLARQRFGTEIDRGLAFAEQLSAYGLGRLPVTSG